MGTFGILFLMVYPWSPQEIRSIGSFDISNVYFDRTTMKMGDLVVNTGKQDLFYRRYGQNSSCAEKTVNGL